MRWDDFARVGSPAVFGPAARGLSVGRAHFPPSLFEAFSKAGLLVEDVADAAGLAALIPARKPDFLICAAAALGDDPEAAVAPLCRSRAGGAFPAILLDGSRTLPERAPGETAFAERLGAGQDALGYFLLLRATLRRKRPHVMTDLLACGTLSLDQEKFALSIGGGQTKLNLLEFCVLGAMLDAPRMVWSKVFLNRVVFGPVDLKPGRQFDTYMSRVRRGIRDRLGIDPIMVQHGMGYALSPDAVGPAELLGNPVRRPG